MKQVVKKSIEELNEILSKEKKLIVKDSTPLIDERSSLESIDLVNLFVNLEKNLKKKGEFHLTFDEIIKNVEQLKTIGSLEIFLTKKFVHIPEVYEKLCTDKLLTMSWLKGKHLLEYKNKSLSERNIIAKNMFLSWYFPNVKMNG